jgi:alcohol dehydrogenase
MDRSSLLLCAPRTLRWVRETFGAPAPHEIVVATRTGAISIGTELPLYAGTHHGSAPLQRPAMTGYESVATVVACGAAVQRVAVGDRVVAFYGHRTHAVLEEHRVVPVPRDIEDAEALLLILACDTAKGVAKMNVQKDDPVLITGAGAIGLLTLFNLKARGVDTVNVIEPNARRRALALQWGARRAMDPAQAMDHKAAYRVGFECSSRNAAFQLLQQLVAHNGRVCVLADGNIEPLVLAPAFHQKELQIVGSSDGEEYPDYARWFWEQVRSKHTPLDQLWEWERPAQELPHVFEQIAQAHNRPLKVLVRYDQSSNSSPDAST